MQVGLRYSFKVNRILELNTAGPEMAQFHLLGIPGVPQTALWRLTICKAQRKIIWYDCGLVPGIANARGQGTLINSQLTGNEFPCVLWQL
jgi:hypothetical protein